MRLARVLVVAVVAACASAARGATGLEGTYRLDRVNGRALPAPSGEEDGVTLHEGTLALQPDGRYEMRVMVTSARYLAPSAAGIGGTWRVSGDSLALLPDPDPDEVQRFTFVRRGPALHLRDEDGDEYRFVRQRGAVHPRN